MRILLTYIFCFIPAYSIAQLPGFLGKKNVLHISANVGPAIKSFGSKSTPGPFNVFLGAGIDRVVSRRWTIGLEYKRNSSEMRANFDNDIERLEGKGEYIYGLKNNMFIFSATCFSMESDFIAPVGRYFSFFGYYNNYTITDIYGNFFGKNAEVYNGLGFGGGMCFGTKRAITDNLIIDYGLNFTYVYSFEYRNFGSKLADDLAENARGSLQGAASVTFKLSAGYLF